MTYFNGNPYQYPHPSHSPLDKFAHDDCLPDSEFTVHTFSNGDTLRQQNPPWHWDRVWGAPNPCYVCGHPVS